ncbi:XRE family transcriptional regulator [Actinophytocola sp.]|uniref:helix-turn-helix domain-containing protein n=1 Tax=Actinophytocola sp. TaxID=1872138 RepID=UPI0025BB47D6|nr:XRE family transcriptional regulator [Actinophytocola sp.]
MSRDTAVDVAARLGLEELDSEAVTPQGAAAGAVLHSAVGARVRDARRRAGLDVGQLAAAVGLTRDKVSKIEHGHRRVSPRELPMLADALRVSIQSLLGSADASRPALALAHRVAASQDSSRLRQRAVELLEIEDRLEHYAGMPGHQLSPGGAAIHQLAATRYASSPRTQPEAQRQGRALADEVRRALDLGSAAIPDLPALIEMHFAADVALSPLGDGGDGLCAHDGDRALILANSDYTAGRVRFTLAHELGHHLLRDPRDVIEESSRDMFANSYRERRVNAFAAHLLLPVRAMDATLAWLDCTGAYVTAATTRGRVALGYLMTRYGVSLQCTLSQLVAAGVLQAADSAALKERLSAHAIVNAAAHLSGDSSTPVTVTQDLRPPARLVTVALDAARSGTVGMNTIARLLDREDDDALFDEVMFGEDGDTATAVPHRGVAAGAASR